MPRVTNTNPEHPEQMRNEFVTSQQAESLKSLGFDWNCRAYYTPRNAPDEQMWFQIGVHDVNRNQRDDLISAPTLAQAAAWLRRHGWHVQPMLNGVRSMYFVRVLKIVGNGEVIDGEQQFDEYEGALSHGIDLAIKRIKRNG